MDDERGAGVVQQVITFEPQKERATGPSRTSRRRRAVYALLGVLAVGLGGVAAHELSASAAGPSTSTDVGQLAALDDDADQQAAAAHLGADVSALPSPAPAARVAAACDLASRITRPLPPDVDRWVDANCAADQEPHDGARYDVGPLDRD